MRRGRTAICLAAVGFLLATQSPARADIGRWGSPVRLRQLARQEAEVRAVGQHRWPRSLLVGSWHHTQYIVVGRDADLVAVARAAPRLLVARKDRVWDLEVPLFVVNGATLTVSAQSVRELRLVTHGGRYAMVVAYGANLRFRGSSRQRIWVHSWAPERHGPDLELDNGRGSISVRGTGRLDASYAVFSYLGFTYGRASGVAVNGFGPRLKGTGSVDHSRFSNNVFGAYTWQAKDMRWTRNAFTRNIVYGLDPHDASDGFLVDYNYAARNGRHGIIFSRLCTRNVIRANVSVRNGWNGIVIDDGRKGRIEPSAFNEISDNLVAGNAKVGISIDGSDHNIVRDNRIRGGRMGVRIIGSRPGHSVGNEIVGNSIYGATNAAIFVKSPAAGTRIVANSLADSETGVAIRGAHDTLITRSRTDGVRRHAVSIVGATRTTIVDNVFSGGGPSVIRAIGASDTVTRGNRFHWRFPVPTRIARTMSWFVGPGIWGLLFLVVLLGPVIRQAAKRLAGTR